MGHEWGAHWGGISTEDVPKKSPKRQGICPNSKSRSLDMEKNQRNIHMIQVAISSKESWGDKGHACPARPKKDEGEGEKTERDGTETESMMETAA